MKNLPLFGSLLNLSSVLDSLHIPNHIFDPWQWLSWIINETIFNSWPIHMHILTKKPVLKPQAGQF